MHIIQHLQNLLSTKYLNGTKFYPLKNTTHAVYFQEPFSHRKVTFHVLTNALWALNYKAPPLILICELCLVVLLCRKCVERKSGKNFAVKIISKKYVRVLHAYIYTSTYMCNIRICTHAHIHTHAQIYIVCEKTLAVKKLWQIWYPKHVWQKKTLAN